MPDALRSVRALDVLQHGPGLFSLTLPKTWEGSANPGSFVFAFLPGAGEKPLSISGEGPDTFELTVRAVGPFTRALSHVRPGSWVGVRGPFGRGFRIDGKGARRVLVAGGIGLAPIRFVQQVLLASGQESTVLLGARTASELCFVKEFLATGARLATDDGSLGTRGFVTELLVDELAHNGAPALVQACGPEAMLLAVQRACVEAGADYELSFERIMKCGLGICGHCCTEGSGIRLCREGPVLGPAELSRFTGFGASKGSTPSGHGGP
jgi:dihydroorotate dehydrogenase electron transfer subunit